MSNSERDELSGILWGHHYEEYTMSHDGTERSNCQCGAAVYPRMSLVQHQAQVALDADYRRPQQINRAEELDALGTKSVILDANGTPLVCDGDAAQPWASVCEDPQGGPIWLDSADVALPATVLHVGGAA